MFMLNGNPAHKHTIRDFKIIRNPTTSNNTTTYNGKATVSLKQGPATGVPISIKLMDDSAVSIWVNQAKRESFWKYTNIWWTT